MNLERTKPETLAAGVMDLTPSQSLAAHEYAERLNAALARLGLTDRLTLPSAPATAIDELPAVVDVPLRKTLSVLMGKAQQGDASALATLEWTAQVAESIFAGLHARDFAGDRPLALPSHESLATLSQGVDALLPRKISNGAWSLLADGTPSDGIDDGVSLVRLLCSSAGSSVTELKDDNEGWELTKSNNFASFPNVEFLEIGCETNTTYVLTENPTLKKVIFKNLKRSSFPFFQATTSYTGNFASLREVEFPELVECCELLNKGGQSGWYNIGLLALERLYLPKLQTINAGTTHIAKCFIGESIPNLKELNMPELVSLRTPLYGASTLSGLESLRMPKLQEITSPLSATYQATLDGLPNLILLEVGAVRTSINLQYWNPTSVLSDSERLPEFLSNFKTYIAERLSEQGSGKTLTLSQAVRDAIEGDPTIAQIITSKGWTISPAPSV